MGAPKLAPELQEKLVAAAELAWRNAYAPFSKFRVGAAVLTALGNIYPGCNVENSSYGLTNCAERTAIFSAVAAEGPAMSIRAMAVVIEGDGPCAPCGACRQVIFEFGPEAVVIHRAAAGLRAVPIAELLPEGFRL